MEGKIVMPDGQQPTLYGYPVVFSEDIHDSDELVPSEGLEESLTEMHREILAMILTGRNIDERPRTD